MGAGGRDFHNFNVFFRDNPAFQVIGFTASQIPNIYNRIYPPKLAGELYPQGIPIYPEEELEELVRKFNIDEVVLAYSDLLIEDVMNKINYILSTGASFRILGPSDTMIYSSRHVIAVCASRTGAGKSTITRYIARILRENKVKYVIVRHPMVYNKDWIEVQRFSSYDDFKKYNCTIEEREEYEWHIRDGNIVYAGIDYKQVLEKAEKEADVIIWDGGNNDWPFFKPNLYITVVDPLRPGHETSSFPGVVNVKLADVVIINKVNVASGENVRIVEENIKKLNKNAVIIKTSSKVKVDKPELIKDKKVLVVEDGPSVTHGHLRYGAGYMAALKFKAKEIVDPRPYAIGSIKEAYEKYEHMGPVLPALGYGSKQMKELEEIINKVPAETIVLGTPSDISRYLKLNKPVVHVSYEVEEVEDNKPLKTIIITKLKKWGLLVEQ